MALKFNLMVGSMAVTFVRNLGVRANNWPSANQMPEAEWNALTYCLDGGPYSVRGQFQDACNGLHATACLHQMPGNLYDLAKAAAKKKCGNCTEQDAVAILYLQAIDVSPLDLMNLAPNNGIDHTFVVIGRLPNKDDPDWATLPQCRVSGSVDTDPTTWGPDAVVCDPWHDMGKVYPATEIQTKMFRGYTNVRGTLQPESIWRLN